MSTSKKYIEDKLNNLDSWVNPYRSRQFSGEIKEFKTKLKLPEGLLNKFLTSKSINSYSIFLSAFSYCLSRFNGSNYSQYLLMDTTDEGNSIFPIIVDCSNCNTLKFIEKVNEAKIMFGDYYKDFDISINNDDNISTDIVFAWNINKEDESNIFTDFRDKFVFFANQRDDMFSLRLKYDSCYADFLIERFIDCFKNIIIGLLKYNQLSEIELIRNDDLAILNKKNETSRGLEYEDFIYAFMDKVNKYPNRKALEYKGHSYTYAELNCITDYLSNEISSFDITCQDTVLANIQHSHYNIIAYLAFLKCNVKYVSVDSQIPNKRVNYICKITNTKLIVCTDDTIENIKGLTYYRSNKTSLVCLNDIYIKKALNNSKSFTLPHYKGSDITCIVFTSGTTGEPKGVCATRLGLLNLCSWYKKAFKLTCEDRSGFILSFIHIAHYWALFALYTGACTVIIPEDLKRDLNKLNDFLNEQDITHFHLTGRMGEIFYNNYNNKVKVFQVGAESHLNIIKNESTLIYNIYGSSEQNMISCFSIEGNNPVVNEIGQPIDNTKAYILDSNWKMLPIGAIGHVCVTGYQLSKGYLDKENTSKNFLECPYETGSTNDNRMFVTGDMGVYLEDGSLLYLGRKDQTFKIRGNRVDATEIEGCISKLDFIKESCTQIYNINGRNQIVVYAILKDGLSYTTKELKDKIVEHITLYKPSYMIPHHVVVLDSLPKTSVGKLDKRALPMPNVSSNLKENLDELDDKEIIIFNAFKNIFKTDKITLDTDFYDLGGDSLSALELISKTPSLNLSFNTIFENKTIKKIAQHVDFNKDVSDHIATEDIEVCGFAKTIAEHCMDENCEETIYREPLIASFIIPDNYSVQDCLKTLYNMQEKFPVLNYKISKSHKTPFMHSGKNREFKYLKNTCISDVYKILDRHFDIYESLFDAYVCDYSNKTYIVFSLSHIIGDYLSIINFRKNFMLLLNSKKLSTDNGLQLWSNKVKIENSSSFKDEAISYFNQNYNIHFRINNNLLPNIKSNGRYEYNFKLSKTLINSLLEQFKITKSVFFTTIFAMALSKLINSKEVMFQYTENGRYNKSSLNSIGCYVCKRHIGVSEVNNNFELMFHKISDCIFKYRKYRNIDDAQILNKYKDNYLSELFKHIEFQFLSNTGNEDVDLYIKNIADGVAAKHVEDLNFIGNSKIVITHKKLSYLLYSDSLVLRENEDEYVLLCEYDQTLDKNSAKVLGDNFIKLLKLAIESNTFEEA